MGNGISIYQSCATHNSQQPLGKSNDGFGIRQFALGDPVSDTGMAEKGSHETNLDDGGANYV